MKSERCSVEVTVQGQAKGRGPGKTLIDLTLSDAESNSGSPHTESITVSIDVGVKNLAYAVVRGHTLHDFMVVNLGLDNNSAENVSTVVQNFVRTYFVDAFDLAMGPHVQFVVEKQMVWSRKCSGVGAARTNAMIETALLTALRHTAGIGRVISSNPQAVQTHFKLPKGYRNKKKAAVKVVQGWIENNATSPLQFEIEAVARFKALKKKDDVADSVLQAAYILMK